MISSAANGSGLAWPNTSRPAMRQAAGRVDAGTASDLRVRFDGACNGPWNLTSYERASPRILSRHEKNGAGLPSNGMGGSAGNVSGDRRARARLWRGQLVVVHTDDAVANADAGPDADAQSNSSTGSSGERGRQLDRHARIVRFRDPKHLDRRVPGRHLCGRRLEH